MTQVTPVCELESQIPKEHIIRYSLATMWLTPQGFIEAVRIFKPETVTVEKREVYSYRTGRYLYTMSSIGFCVEVTDMPADRIAFGDVAIRCYQTEYYIEPSKEIGWIINQLKKMGYKFSKVEYDREYDTKYITYSRTR